MRIERLTVGPLQVNCYLVFDEETRQGIIVDAGDEPELIIARVDELSMQVMGIVSTHGHVDHVGAVEPLKDHFGVDFMLHAGDVPFLAHTGEAGIAFGMQGLQPPTADRELQQGDVIAFAGAELEVIETPGHSPGSVVLSGRGFALVGDLVFQGSVGRTDLPGSDHNAMIDSLEKKLLILPDETRLYPGHGEATSLAIERKYNPFLQGLGYDEKRRV